MEFNVINHQLCVGEIKVIGVASSALFLIGDVQTVQLSSAFDTPPESLIIGPVVPFAPKG
ncbi:MULTISPECIES: spore gernimation protein GerPD [Peribacillus]|uniref:spore gernimation protein GerPD n=1 Tax=Peribacillus TaxID=2675229 RepID=UPI0021A3DDA0|nr:spore gernimation protein GerPD [Peribacillus sp. BBB004]